MKKSIFGMRDHDDSDEREKERDLEDVKYLGDLEDEREISIRAQRETDMEDRTLSLRQEELDVTKNRIQSGEVILSKDIIEEKKTIDVPIINEEVVIERRSINNEVSDMPITSEEAIRIPVSQENVEIGRHTVITGEVSVHKREVESVHHVEETIKREEARINSTGDAEIIDNEINSIH